MCGSQKKTKQSKTKQITSILGQKDKFRTVFSQNGENDQKSSWKIFPDFLTLTSYKSSEKCDERFPRKSVMDERTDGYDS